MPVMDGYEAIGILKEDPELRHIPVIAVTASAMKKTKSEILAICEGYLSKPVSRKSLYAQLTRFLRFDRRAAEDPDDDSPADEAKSSFAADATELLSLPPEKTELVRNRLENELMPLWTELHEYVVMDDIKTFAALVMEIGEENRVSCLRSFGARLREYALVYDVDGVEVTMARFPGVAEEILCALAEKRGVADEKQR
jgi:CheY-like chemotaxis protein